MMPLPPLNKFLTLLTLVTSLQGKADGEYCRNSNPEKPKMAASLESPRKYVTRELNIHYGQDITVTCSGSDASNIAIESREPPGLLQVHRVNSTTVESVTVSNLHIGCNSFFCIDSNTTCNGNIIVIVSPALSVTGPGVQHSLDRKTYFVPRGEIYNVFCTASDVNKIYLSETTVYLGDLPTKAVNETTLIATLTNNTTTEVKEFDCGMPVTDIVFTAMIKVIVDRIPEVREFWCVLYQNLQLECSWTGYNKDNSYALYMLRDQTNTRLCSDRPNSLASGCKYALDTNLLFLYDFSFSLELETCNQVYCRNQTFPINSVGSIVKVEPVFDLELLKTYSHGASLKWYQHLRIELAVNKLEYRLLGMEWQPVKTSVECLNAYSYEDYLFEHSGCTIDLSFPCPDTHYEVRVYVKHKLTSGDRYWSEPVSFFFFTAPSTADYVEPACDVDFRDVTEKPHLKAVDMLYAVRELISDVQKEKSTLKKYVSGTNQKLTKIKSLIP